MRKTPLISGVTLRALLGTLIASLFVMSIPALAQAKQIKTNEVLMTNAPSWLKAPRVERVTSRIQHKLEWTTRLVTVHWYASEEEFVKSHSLGLGPTAVTRIENGTASIHMGPDVVSANFDQVFGHELVHVILFQKYKGAIPKWLEEGLANHLSKNGRVDYKWLAKQPYPKSVLELAHPFSASSGLVSYRYKASQALAEMLDRKCGGLENLIRLSVGKKLEDYLPTACEIKDINHAFKEWVEKKSK